MAKKQTRRPRPTKDELDQLQIEEYIATNPYGPGDRTITGVELLLRLAKKPKD